MNTTNNTNGTNNTNDGRAAGLPGAGRAAVVAAALVADVRRSMLADGAGPVSWPWPVEVAGLARRERAAWMRKRQDEAIARVVRDVAICRLVARSRPFTASERAQLEALLRPPYRTDGTGGNRPDRPAGSRPARSRGRDG